MNIKTLSFTILSILMLTACGGGSSSDSNGALLHKDFKDRVFLSCSNLSDNLGMRSA